MKKLFTPILITLLVMVMCNVYAQTRGRVKVLNNTVVSDRNTLLRFSHMALGRGTDYDSLALTATGFYPTIRSHGLNGIRLMIWRLGGTTITYPTKYPTPSSYFTDIDRVVNLAEANGLYVLIDYHGPKYLADISNTSVYNEISNFWKAVAPRYKDRTHVFYEIVNEPAWKSAAQQQAMINLYKTIRGLAPNTHISCWGLDRINDLDAILNQAPGINYSNASVSYHCYSTSQSSALSLKAKYPVFCTENTNFGTLFKHADPIGISWCAWQGQNGNWANFDQYIRDNNISWSGDYADYPSGGGGSNKLPSVSVTSPANNASFNTNSSVTVSASASDADGTISKVVFYYEINTLKTTIGTDTSSPYSITWTTPSTAGTYNIFAEATDNSNGIATSNFVSVAVGTTPPPGTSLTLTPVADAYVKAGINGAINYGTATVLQVKNDADVDSDRNTLLKFDITNSPASSSITSAKLRLYGKYMSTTTPAATSCYSVTNDTWTESGATWNNQPSDGSSLSTVTVTSTAKYWEWDVTSFVKSEKAAGQTLLSLKLRNLLESGSHNEFNSRQASANKPQLLIISSSAATSLSRLAGPESAPSEENIGDAESNLAIFPNPASGAITLRLYADKAGDADVSLINTLGSQSLRDRRLLTAGNNEWSVNVAHLQPGLYILTLHSAKGLSKQKLLIR